MWCEYMEEVLEHATPHHAGAFAPTFRWNGAKLLPWQILATAESPPRSTTRHDEAPPPSQGGGASSSSGQSGYRPVPLGEGEVHGAAHHGHRLPGPAATQAVEHDVGGVQPAFDAPQADAG